MTVDDLAKQPRFCPLSDAAPSAVMPLNGTKGRDTLRTCSIQCAWFQITKVDPKTREIQGGVCARTAEVLELNQINTHLERVVAHLADLAEAWGAAADVVIAMAPPEIREKLETEAKVTPLPEISLVTPDAKS